MSIKVIKTELTIFVIYIIILKILVPFKSLRTKFFKKCDSLQWNIIILYWSNLGVTQGVPQRGNGRLKV